MENMTTKVQGRQSIHRERTQSPTTTRTKTNQTRRPEFNESSLKNKSDVSDSEESLDEETSYIDKLNRQNGSFRNKIPISPKPIKSPNHVRKDNSISSSKRPTQPPESENWLGIKLILVVVMMAIIPAVYYQKTMISNHGPRKCSFSTLKAKYPKEKDSLWLSLKYGNENILNNESDKPAVFLFVHHGKKISDSLVNDIASTSASCYGSSPILKHMDFTTKEAIEDYGHIIEKYKKQIKEENVILIANLNRIPGEAAKALHAICDTVTPLVKKVIVMLTLTVKEQNQQEKVIDTVESTLRELWQHKMNEYELEPIITRVADQVFLLRSD